jgi:putative membrane protein
MRLFSGSSRRSSGFHVAGFWAAFWGAIAYSILSWAVAALVLPERD